MTEPRDASTNEPGSASQSPSPFAWRAPVSSRQDTVISTPYREDGQPASSNHPNASGSPSDLEFSPPPISPLQAKLFPGQAVAAIPEDVAGLSIGHFTLERRIGVGGMGTVFLARDERLQRPVALKVLSPQQMAEPAAVQRFQNEARAAARLDHEHVARVFFYGDDQSLHYIAFEYVQGQNLREVIRAKGRLEPADVVNYGVQLAAALCHTASCGVVHRDIKPSNIIVTPTGKAKLVDLGLARKESFEESAQLTVAGTTLGTFDYISPEQAKDPRNVDVRSDIYSLGCTLYHLVTGEPPFPEGTVLQRLLDHYDKEPPDPSLKNRRVSPALSAIIRKMMQGDPNRRYRSAEDLLRDLLLLGNAMGLRTVSADSAVMTALNSSPRGSRWQNAGWIATTLLLFTAVGILQAYPQLLTTVAPRPDAATAAAPTGQNTTPATTGNTESTKPSTTSDGVLASSTELPRATPDKTEQTAPSTTSITNSLEPLLGNNNPVFDLNQSPFTEGLRAPKRRPIPFEGSISPVVPDANEGVDVDVLTPPETLAGNANSDRTANPDAPSIGIVRTRPVTPTEPTTSSARNANGGTLAPPLNPDLPFIITDSGQSYATLEAACAEARETATIELHYDGRRPLPLTERPIRLINKRVTIQAAKGRRPIITFQPKEHTSDPTLSRLVLVSGGALTLINVEIEARLPEHSTADRWILFALERPEKLRLLGSQVTIHNPRNHPAAVFGMPRPTGDAFSRMQSTKDGLPSAVTEVFVERSFVRGVAEGLIFRDAANLRMQFEDSICALAESLVHTQPPPELMTPGLKLELEFKRCTVLVGHSLVLMDGNADVTGAGLPVAVRSRDNIFACGTDRPLIEQSLPVEMVKFRESLEWSGERNYFDNIGQFWVVNAPTASAASMQRWDFALWSSHWRANDCRNDAVGWSRPWRLKPWSELSRDDVALDRMAENNRPLGGATDGGDAGAPHIDVPTTAAPLPP